VHVAFFMILCLTSQLGHVLLNSIFSIFFKLCFFCATCVQVYDFPFIHGFQALPLKFVKVQTNISLPLNETKSCLNFCWSQWLNFTLEIFMIPSNFVHKLQMTMILMMMTCLTSHLVVVKIYFVSKCLWVFVFEIFHISNSSLICINVVSKSCCN
jgi:hypothetical protein